MKKLVIFCILLIASHVNYALSAPMTACDNCYKCVSFSSTGCTRCEYDVNYCSEERLCELPKVLKNGECVCPTTCVGVQDPDTCECSGCGLHVGCEEGMVWNEEICDCEKIKCKSGWYHNGSGCVACPGNTSTGDGVYVEGVVNIACGSHSSNYGADGITNCYQKSWMMLGSYCKYSDDTGEYEVTDNCYYNTLTFTPIQ